MSPLKFWLLIVALLLGPWPAEHTFARPNWEAASTVLQRACGDCHGESAPEGEVDLTAFDDEAEAMANYTLWQKVQRLVKNGEMPPPDAGKLATEDRELLLDWIDGTLDRVAQANAGDPGWVTLRRLTNTEYDNTIRDLTGLDLHLSDRFAKDSGGGEGFTNTGDVLFVSPEQLEKYLEAARDVASRAAVLPGAGIEFRAAPVNLRGPASIAPELDRRVRTWYYDRLGPMIPEGLDEMRIEDYLHACWRHRHGQGELASLAKEDRLDPVFLENWWDFLQKETSNPILNRIRLPWHELPGPKNAEVAKEGIQAIAAEQRIWMTELQHVSAAERQEGEEYFHL